ncbi:MAG: molybdopterin molybdotransferase MoeA [Anaerolineaceae bacterium]|nr:molybdopterin molybdotransferase MoeA [Anaerolineaceae bacterium]
MVELLQVSDARNRMLARVSPLDTERVDLNHAWKRVLAHDVFSDTDWPPFANSSMDGFAVRATGIAEATPNSPVTLKVVADIPAGSISSIDIQEGQAARIMTGAPIPRGADAVIPVEDTNLKESQQEPSLPDLVQIFHSVAQGSWIRPRGQDLHAGQLVLSAGNTLRAQDVGLLAMLGISEACVFKRPRVALLSTGDELQPPDQPLTPGKIPDSNSFSLAILLTMNGCEVIPLGISADQYSAVQERLDRAVSENADLILSSAGVSVGTYDYVKAVIESHGRLDFWRVNMRPGKPVAFGEYRGIPVVGLPGNPVSAFIGFEVFVAAVLRKLSGLRQIEPEITPATLSTPIDSDGRESYLRAIVNNQDGKRSVRLTGHQGSGNLFSLVQANALLIVPSGVKSLPAGSEVGVWLFEH